jgi:hypothetical protein
MSQTGRLYRCARCHEQVVVCQRCDRGQIYCAAGCAALARRERQRGAGERYQASRRGRFVHAERSRRYRQRRRALAEIVTHQGCVAPDAGALLRTEATVTVTESIDTVVEVVAIEVMSLATPTEPSSSCKHCGARCAGGVRNGYLRHRRRASNSGLADRTIGQTLRLSLNDHWP